jgi:hypothetical protein
MCSSAGASAFDASVERIPWSDHRAVIAELTRQRVGVARGRLSA